MNLIYCTWKPSVVLSWKCWEIG